MSGIPRTDKELLRCAPPLDIAMFLEAKDNMIAQDYGKCCKNVNIYQYIFFCHVNKFKRPVDSGLFGQISIQTPGCLDFVMIKFFGQKIFSSDWSLQILLGRLH